MKTPFLIILTFLGMLMANQLSFASFLCSDNWYLAGSGSINWHTIHKFPNTEHRFFEGSQRSYKTGGGANVSFGYIFNLYKLWDLRLEGEMVYKRNALSLLKGKVSGIGRTQDIGLMANILTDIPLYSCLDWYFGGGLGLTFNELHLTAIKNIPIPQGRAHNEYLACQIISGLAYNISPDVTLTAGYRLLGTQKIRNPQGVKSKEIPLTQSIDIGMRFRL